VAVRPHYHSRTLRPPAVVKFFRHASNLRAFDALLVLSDVFVLAISVVLLAALAVAGAGTNLASSGLLCATPSATPRPAPGGG
jgi:hypothetical protein